MNEDEILMGATQIAHKVQKKVLVKKKNVKATGKHRSNKFLVVVFQLIIIMLVIKKNYANAKTN